MFMAALKKPNCLEVETIAWQVTIPELGNGDTVEITADHGSRSICRNYCHHNITGESKGVEGEDRRYRKRMENLVKTRLALYMGIAAQRH